MLLRGKNHVMYRVEETNTHTCLTTARVEGRRAYRLDSSMDELESKLDGEKTAPRRKKCYGSLQ